MLSPSSTIALEVRANKIIDHSESGAGLKVGVIPLSTVSPLTCAIRIWSDTACVAQLDC